METLTTWTPSSVQDELELSIVSTLYRSSGCLRQFVCECAAAAKAIGKSRFELILVNDGSPDDSLEVALDLKREMPEIVVADLTRNFGHHYAAHAGLSLARGELVFLIDSDLEVSPSVLMDFHRELERGGWDVVFGYQKHRKGGRFEQVSGALFWHIFNVTSGTKVPPNVLTERLMRRHYVSWLLKLGDRNLFMAGMMYWTGGEQCGIPVLKRSRPRPSAYSLARKVDLMVEAVTSFSAAPLRWIFYAGTFIALASALFLVGLLILKLAAPDRFAAGWPSLIGAIAFGIGITNASIGLLGIYLFKVYGQVQGRPRYIIRALYR
jgi:putative glycosyltransferase